MVTDLVEVRRLAESKRTENLEFRRYLQKHHQSDSVFRIISERVEPEIDCKKCANCCRHTTVTVSVKEIAEIAGYLRIEPEQVTQLYTTSEDGETILKNEPDGCVFLHGNECTIYEARPRACRDFPHVLAGVHSVGSRMSSVCRSASICPILYNALEIYKKAIGYPPLSQKSQAG